jgi:DNA helicase-2/ATP-dependent DNA helicase PcrA
MDLLAGLNPPQRQAVTHIEGPLLILAGAGSGKTRVITQRIGYLIREIGVKPWSILAVTFTNKAAGEMKERVCRLLDDAGSGPLLSTFHSFCVRLLRRDGARLAEIRPGFKRDFLIYDDDDQLGLIKAIYRELNLDEKQWMPYRTALARIGAAKSERLAPHEVARQNDPKARMLATVYRSYEDRLHRANALDFDDLLLEAVRLLKHDAELRRTWNERLHFVMIDEYQDTNRSQYDLMRLLTERRRNVCVVGDEDQSIYSWRGADIRNILDFEKDYPGATVIRLEQNYRSTKTILEATGAVIANNLQRKGKTLWTDGGQGERIVLYEAPDAENEGLFIAHTIDRLLRSGEASRAAVLYRTNAQSRLIEEGLRRYGRTYQVVGGFSFYQRAEIKDTLAYLKLAMNPADSVSLLRIVNTPARGIGKTTMEQAEAYAWRNGLTLWDAIARMLEEEAFPPRAASALRAFRHLIEEIGRLAGSEKVGGVVRAILELTGYRAMLKKDTDPAAESRLENLDELVNAAEEAAERGETAAEFLDHAALVAETDDIDGEAPVLLLTAHNAKGLEFPAVFLAGLEEGLLPHSRSLDSETMLEEERRLCYVAMTRAQERLYLTRAALRRRWGAGYPEESKPSRFLREVPPHLVDRQGDAPRSYGEDAEVDLYAERHAARQTARRTTYTGTTYNSVENIADFFRRRGLPPPAVKKQPPASPAPMRPLPPKAGGRGKSLAGASVVHERYGKGQVLRVEGEGDDAKLTVMFPGYGLKKLVRKYAQLKTT